MWRGGTIFVNLALGQRIDGEISCPLSDGFYRYS